MTYISQNHPMRLVLGFVGTGHNCSWSWFYQHFATWLLLQEWWFWSSTNSSVSRNRSLDVSWIIRKKLTLATLRGPVPVAKIAHVTFGAGHPRFAVTLSRVGFAFAAVGGKAAVTCCAPDAAVKAPIGWLSKVKEQIENCRISDFYPQFIINHLVSFLI